MYGALIFAVSQHKSCQNSGLKYACFTFFKVPFCCVICPFAF